MTDQTPPLDADQVAAWLEQHPDFFADREDLLA